MFGQTLVSAAGQSQLRCCTTGQGRAFWAIPRKTRAASVRFLASPGFNQHPQRSRRFSKIRPLIGIYSWFLVAHSSAINQSTEYHMPPRYGNQRTKAAQVAILQRLWPRDRSAGKVWPTMEAHDIWLTRHLTMIYGGFHKWCCHVLPPKRMVIGGNSIKMDDGGSIRH